MPSLSALALMDKPHQLLLSVQNPARASNVPTRAQVRKLLTLALTRSAEITVRFASAAEARVLNRDYRGRDYATNILSFPYNVDDINVNGDLVLCPEVVEREAQAQDKALATHYAHLLLHGVLHLQGWDHDNDIDAKSMEARECELLAQIGIADPYQLQR